ncbi:hypothetical protein DFH05DRAFT_1055542 [Lentinula detonsa]|uniref:Uncharacterized protein n=1 Tax=Lentinula detonsa TaxID=2804962 RepID=A0A9W8TYP8_9AGAR|nr:hypothetical protein DFH05DRAFT_1055542 [Lentinula detonsa]KAJ3982791.1 hypothetical protein F5890DRAFT_1527359 [Lentinula detonsa]
MSTVQTCILLWLCLASIAVSAPIPASKDFEYLSDFVPAAITIATTTENFLYSLLESEFGSGGLDNSREDIMDNGNVKDLQMGGSEQIFALAEPGKDVSLTFLIYDDALDGDDHIFIDVDEDSTFVDFEKDLVGMIENDEDFVDDDTEACDITDLGSDEEAQLWSDLGDFDFEEDNVGNIEWEKARAEILVSSRIHRKRQLMNPYIPPYKIV